ncbi:hypothetical protein F5878DRAFT_668001 [Lentinula raphanica]|uniref:Uncharacterized protein n=1 Tax=Lentinula raphanica TaxID=153919 RepID=A0AA38U3P5_9AGAR|nr:hypothetical protein F5878DRAFT_668001 [Lentinula raphanica]
MLNTSTSLSTSPLSPLFPQPCLPLVRLVFVTPGSFLLHLALPHPNIFIAGSFTRRLALPHLDHIIFDPQRVSPDP